MLPATAILTFWLALASAPAPASEGFVVVVHPDNPAAELSTAEVSRLFLKKTVRWTDGRPVQPVEPVAPALRQRFSDQVHGRSVAAIKSYWNQLIFSGRDVPPLEKPDDAGVVAYVRANPGAIGYVSPGADLAGVKPLAVKP